MKEIYDKDLKGPSKIATQHYVNTGGHSIPNASKTVVGGIKVVLVGTVLYMSNDGTSPV